MPAARHKTPNETIFEAVPAGMASERLPQELGFGSDMACQRARTSFRPARSFSVRVVG